MGAVTHCHSAAARAESLLGTVRAVVARPGRLRGDTEGTGMLGVWEHRVCKSELEDPESTGTLSTGDTERTGMCEGTLSLWGHQAQRDTKCAGTRTMQGHRIPLAAALWEQSWRRAGRG